MSTSFSWRCPSNIALVKYWGKHGLQLPVNASLSFTLENCFTETTLICSPKASSGFDITVFLDGREDQKFKEKILTFFSRITSHFDFLEKYSFEIRTRNSFPHSSGIASSASGFGALALCLCSLENQGAAKTPAFLQKASEIARIGSGSAARSVYGGFTVWGKHNDFSGSSDEYAIPVPFEVHPVFSDLRDTVMLVHKGQKTVSSTVGHSLMNGHPFAAKRIEVAGQNMTRLKNILESGDFDAFGKLIEAEALMLHALMMTSEPNFLLMKPETLAILEKVREFRNSGAARLFFTLDAGANVHLIYPGIEASHIEAFIDGELSVFCENKAYICDRIGIGPQEIKPLNA